MPDSPVPMVVIRDGNQVRIRLDTSFDREQLVPATADAVLFAVGREHALAVAWEILRQDEEKPISPFE